MSALGKHKMADGILCSFNIFSKRATQYIYNQQNKNIIHKMVYIIKWILFTSRKLMARLLNNFPRFI